MKLPSCTLTSRMTAGLYVIVSVMPDSCEAPVIDTGTRYGPPPRRKSGPGTDITICPADAVTGPGTGDPVGGAGTCEMLAPPWGGPAAGGLAPCGGSGGTVGGTPAGPGT